MLSRDDQLLSIGLADSDADLRPDISSQDVIEALGANDVASRNLGVVILVRERQWQDTLLGQVRS